MPSLRRALLILPVWIICVLWMWSWWLTADFMRFLPLYIPLTLALLYEFAVLPSIFLYFIIKAKRHTRRIAPKNKKVAVISLCVPSVESLDIVENQLRAMANITYPHDSWILDEGNSKAIKKLAKKYGVKHFSRKGIDAYNQDGPPFQKKTKAGNVNAWLKHVKSRKYDFFVQLDIDHIPRPNYLNKTLGYFRDPGVAWVQAPSVYKNMEAWTARGAAEQELVLQGPLQMGFYGHSETPFIIGSHCTYRMSAINEIGGFQPTRAEDHLDTVYLANKGYKGVFISEIIAEGDGPETLNIYLAQQFAWAYSMIQVLLVHTPKLLKAMPLKRKSQFLFAQTWYPLWTLSYLIMFFCPLIALLVNRDVVSVDPQRMLLHFVPIFVCSYLVWWAARPIMQPRGLMLSWRGIILHAVRWPIILRAIFAALFKVKKPYMITPKGTYARMVPSLATYRPFLLLGLLSAGSVILAITARHGDVPEAQVVYSIINAVFMLTICTIDIGLRLHQTRPKFTDFKQYWLKPALATTVLATTLGMSILTSYIGLNQPPAAAANSLPANNQAVVPRPVNYLMTNEEIMTQISYIPKSVTDLPGLGMYTPIPDLPKSQTPYIEHSFVDWRDDHYFAVTVAKSLQAGNTPLVTLEPEGEEDGTKLLNDIAAGRYDPTLDKLITVSNESKNTIYIRFGHEMELADLYPWGNQDPDLYIKAYQHVVDYYRAHDVQNIQFVWSPAGNRTASAYYPGDTYVDAIGTTILYDQHWYGDYLPTFGTLASNRQWLQEYGKPVWIVEFGAGRSNKSNQKQLISEATQEYKQRGYQALIYLNMIDANINGPDYRLDSLNDFGSFYDSQESPQPESKNPTY